MLFPGGCGSFIFPIDKNDQAGEDRLGTAHDINLESTMTRTFVQW